MYYYIKVTGPDGEPVYAVLMRLETGQEFSVGQWPHESDALAMVNYLNGGPGSTNGAYNLLQERLPRSGP